MAILRYRPIVDSYDDGDYMVSKDDSTMTKYFDNREDAEVYYHYLIQIETQERIADNQEKAVKQNEQIIKNQNRIIDDFPRYPRIQIVKQEMDPEYEEWLRYKKATDPKYKKWKADEERKVKEKERKEAEKKRKEQEAIENKRKELLTTAKALDEGTISKNIPWNAIAEIIDKELYVFTNQEVILKIAENIMLGWESKLLRDYGDVPGIYRRIINNPYFSYLSFKYLQKIVKANLNDKEFLLEFFVRGEKHTVLDQTILALLDSSTLSLLLSKNIVPEAEIEFVQDLLFWLDNRDRIFSGEIKNDKDLEFAEKHYYESDKNYEFLLSLAKKSSKKDIFINVDNQTRNMTVEEKIEIYRALLENPNYEYKSHLLEFLIDNYNTETMLRELKQYCIEADGNKTNVRFSQWLKRMEDLGFINGKWGRRREIASNNSFLDHILDSIRDSNNN